MTRSVRWSGGKVKNGEAKRVNGRWKKGALGAMGKDREAVTTAPFATRPLERVVQGDDSSGIKELVFIAKHEVEE